MKTTLQDRLNFDLQQMDKSEWIIGLDEVGWGCIAGDLVLGAVAIHRSLLENFTPPSEIFLKVRDSKKLSSKIRQDIYTKTKESDFKGKLFFTLGHSSINLINEQGLALAYDEALHQIIKHFEPKIDFQKTLLLLDGSREPKFLKTYPLNKNIIVKGDDASFSIGLASIIAKEFRDDLMTQLHEKYPQYHWLDNKGYGTALHIEALKKFGLTPHHRLKGTTTILSK